ncbi:kinetochore scaffold 1-like [Denticeps clupeoides]|uniref:kinetochore scaffold 1-like n=1 Tax=Denticeps clupeoides TaxID=299321 RepID=UPI0010A53B9F|nr:kinetochore scaffold 1-like [Denticeps clupeoides]
MDPTETLRFDFEPAGSSRRRISSILKAPRPSTRLSDSDQKEVQAENVRPTEKRRNSRRVSFASKNDIRLFANNERGAPPVRSPLQDVFTSGTDPESTKGIYIHEDGTQPVSGMDDLLMAPLHVSQLNNKVRFFTDPTVQGDQTKVFDAEEDAYMDMTHCHTIVIDKDSNLNLDCGTEMTSSGLSKNETTQDKSIFHTQVERDTDFLAFLAGFSQKDNSKKCDVAPKNVDYVTGTDKENLPPVLSSRRSDRPGTSQSQGLHLKRRSTGHPEQQLIERTKIHTEGGGPRHGHYDVPGQGLHWISASQQSTLPNNEDDMELTRNQTVAIKFKTTDVDNRAETLRLDPNNTKIFSADECGMELTGVVSGSFGIQGQVETQFSKTACASTHELGNQHWGGGFPSVANALCLPDSDSTQIPCISTVNIKSKGFDQVEPFGEVRRSMLSNQTVVDCEGMNLTKALHGHIEVTHMGRDETNKTLIFSKDDCDGMELTQGQNVVINFKCSEKEQYVHKPRKSLSFHQTVDFMQDEAMELTEAVTACIEAKRNDTIKIMAWRCLSVRRLQCIQKNKN